eukprot:1773003-Rhodomonas_salina.2
MAVQSCTRSIIAGLILTRWNVVPKNLAALLSDVTEVQCHIWCHLWWQKHKFTAAILSKVLSVMVTMMAETLDMDGVVHESMNDCSCYVVIYFWILPFEDAMAGILSQC